MLSEQLIKESLRGLKANRIRKRDEQINKHLDYYSGSDTEQYVEGFFDAETLKEAPISKYNFTDRFIDKMSRIYQSGVKREAGENYKKMTVNKDSSMKHLEKMNNLNGSMATLIKLRNGVYTYQQIYKFTPFFGDDPLNPIAVAYPIVLPVSDPSNDDELGWAYWDDTLYKKYDDNGSLIEEIEHGLGVLPVVFTHKDHQLDEFFVEGATDIVAANEQVNITMTELAVGSRYQLWGQPWGSGIDSEGGTMRMGVQNVVTLSDPESRFGIESSGGDLNASIEYVKFMVELCAQNNHLWITWAETGGEVPSGISLMIRDLERHEDYIDDIELYRIYENRFYEVEKAYAKLSNIKLPDELGMDFILPEYPLSINDQILWDNHRLEKNLITQQELTLEKNKDLNNLETATQVWEMRKELNDKNRNNVLVPEVKGPTPKIDNRTK